MLMNNKVFILAIAIVFLFSCSNENGEYNILKFGADKTGKNLSTDAIQKAIDMAANCGGGTVIIPAGIYKSGTIHLKSNIRFDIQEGATIIGSENIEDYDSIRWGHNVDRQPWHLLLVDSCENVTICGAGTIDGNGEAYWKNYNADSLPQWIMAKEKKISPMMEVHASKNIRIHDVCLKTGGGWTLHLYNSDHVQVQGIRILNNIYAPNGDGIDISGCADVTISDCIIKTCDDAICLKTMVDTRECKRITVTNCVIECLCAALKIGNESFRDISQVTFSNCIIYGSSRAIGIYAESAGEVRDVSISNIIADTKVPLLYNRPIHISLYLPKTGAGGRNGDWLFKECKAWDYEGKEPKMKNITITNFTCTTEGRVLIAAEEGRQIENLTLRDIRLTYPFIEDPRPNIEKAKSSQFSPHNPEAKVALGAMVIQNVTNLVVDGFTIDWPTADTIPNEWKFPKRIANGTLESFYADYSKVKQTELSAIWGKGIDGGYIFAPMARASSSTMKTFDLTNSTVTIK